MFATFSSNMGKSMDVRQFEMIIKRSTSTRTLTEEVVCKRVSIRERAPIYVCIQTCGNLAATIPQASAPSVGLSALGTVPITCTRKFWGNLYIKKYSHVGAEKWRLTVVSRFVIHIEQIDNLEGIWTWELKSKQLANAMKGLCATRDKGK